MGRIETTDNNLGLYDLTNDSKNDIKEYYKYWRDNFEIKRLPFIKKAGGFEGRKFLYENLKDFHIKSSK